MKDTGRNTNKIENNKKIVKEKEKSNKKTKQKEFTNKKFQKFLLEKEKKHNMKVMLLNLKSKLCIAVCCVTTDAILKLFASLFC